MGKSGKYFDITSELNVELIDENDRFSKYLSKHGDGTMYMKGYDIMTGIEVYFYDIHMVDENIENNISKIDFLQISYCHSGIYSCTIGKNRKINFHAGEVFVGNNIYSWKNSINTKAKMSLGYFEGLSIMIYLDKIDDRTRDILGYFEIDLEKLKERLLSGGSMNKFACTDISLRLFQEMMEANKRDDLSYIKRLVVELLIELQNKDTALTKNYYNMNDSLVDKIVNICQYIRDNYQNHISIAKLSEQFGISSTTLKINFKKMYGHGIYEFLKRYRMEIAANKLKLSNEPITKIAYNVGYENSSKFSAAFRSVYGVNPRNYRKSDKMEH